MDQIETELLHRSKTIKRLKRAKMQFYKFLLKDGLDFRNTGIAWLVDSLANAGEEVRDEHLPNFLDTKAREFVLQKALYLGEMDTISKR